MELAGLISSILTGAADIDAGRKNLSADGREHEGRLLFEDGISKVLAAFKSAQSSGDPKIMLLSESSFLEQEFQFCGEDDASTKNSLTQAIQGFEDAFRCLKTVEIPSGYRALETGFPTSSKYRYQNFPRDAVHLACAAHWTRLQNSLRTPGINKIEKVVLQQRAANMKTVQVSYIEKQKKALGRLLHGSGPLLPRQDVP